MLIRMHTGMSLDGLAATPDGVPAMDAMPGFVPGESYGMEEFLEQCVAVVVGRTTLDEGLAYWSVTTSSAEPPSWRKSGKTLPVLLRMTKGQNEEGVRRERRARGKGQTHPSKRQPQLRVY